MRPETRAETVDRRVQRRHVRGLAMGVAHNNALGHREFGADSIGHRLVDSRGAEVREWQDSAPARGSFYNPFRRKIRRRVAEILAPALGGRLVHYRKRPDLAARAVAPTAQR